MKKTIGIGVIFLAVIGCALPAFAEELAVLSDQVTQVAQHAKCQKYFASSRDTQWDQQESTREGCYEMVTDELHRRRAAAGHTKPGESVPACRQVGSHFQGEAWRLSRDAQRDIEKGSYASAKTKFGLAEGYLKLARTELLAKGADSCMPVASTQTKTLDSSAVCELVTQGGNAERAL